MSCSRGSLSLTPINYDSSFGPPVFQQHLDDFGEIPLRLVDIGTLRVSTRPPRNVAHQESGLRVSLDHRI